jgi:hypothetical protein
VSPDNSRETAPGLEQNLGGGPGGKPFLKGSPQSEDFSPEKGVPPKRLIRFPVSGQDGYLVCLMIVEGVDRVVSGQQDRNRVIAQVISVLVLNYNEVDLARVRLT